MNEEQNMPDEVWRRAFDDAAETPPPRVWNAIERQLDEPDGGRVVPLWANGLSRPLLWSTGLAAAVALLLVGVWLSRTAPAEQPAVAHVQDTVTERPAVAIRPDGGVVQNDAEKSAPSSALSKPVAEPPVTDRSDVKTDASEINYAQRFQERVAHVETIEQETIVSPSAAQNTLTMSSARPITAFSTILNKLTDESGLSAFTAPQPLRSREARLYEMKPLQRVVELEPIADKSVQPTAIQTRVATKTRWASLSIMPGIFNPGVAVALPIYTNAFVNSTNVKTGTGSAVTSRAGVAVAIQATAGVQLTDRWSIESGVGYLAGRSTAESPGAQPVYNFAQSSVVASTVPSAAGNLYTDLLSGQVGRATANRTASASADQFISNTNRYANLSSGSYGNQQTVGVANDYAYVQVPVQVGYELRPRKRLTLAVLGGLITNIFVKNTVGDALTVKPGDGVYEPVALVASMGARFRYRSSERWSASVAGVYQPAITRSTRPDSPVQTQPATTGVTVGVDYHF